MPTNINADLDSLLATKKIWIYSDGGASTHGQKTGAHAAMILFPDGTKRLVCGACNWTKINRMELSAINAALYYIRMIHYEGIAHGVKIQIITDSEVTMRGVTGEQRGATNADLWAAFDALAAPFDSIDITHMSRNAEPAQAQSDAACHIFRVEFEKLLGEFVDHPGFSTLEVGRGARIGSRRKEPTVTPQSANEANS